MTPDPIVIVGAARTPMGAFLGDLSPLSAPELGAAAIAAAQAQATIGGGEVDEVFMGCVLPAGLGQAPARQASIGAGNPESVGCTTVNKVCGSGMKAAMLAHDLLAGGNGRIMVEEAVLALIVSQARRRSRARPGRFRRRIPQPRQAGIRGGTLQRRDRSDHRPIARRREPCRDR